MRELHFVGFTADNSGMILAGRRGAKTGGYVLHLDTDVVEQIQRAGRVHDIALGRRGPSTGPTGKAESGLTPREIQSRIRSGRSLSDIAVEAGVGIDWVERFAPPILAERDAVVSRAGAMFVTNPAGEMSERSLVESVRRNLQNRGVHLTDDELEQCWSAGYLEQREWLVSLRARIKGRDVDAQWTLSNVDSTLAVRNTAGEDLGFVGPDRPRVRSRRSEPEAAAEANPVSDETTDQSPPSASPGEAVPEPTVPPVSEAVTSDQPTVPEDSSAGETSGPSASSDTDLAGPAPQVDPAPASGVDPANEPPGTDASEPVVDGGSSTDRLFDVRADGPESISLPDLG